MSTFPGCLSIFSELISPSLFVSILSLNSAGHCICNKDNDFFLKNSMKNKVYKKWVIKSKNNTTITFSSYLENFFRLRLYLKNNHLILECIKTTEGFRRIDTLS